jgi:DNA-binding transcriptional ArsR family regulator
LTFNDLRASVVAMRSSRESWISRIDQMRALSSPVRQELLDVLARMGTVSLAELGAVLGRPADGLYYHVRLLKRRGLVRSAGTRVVRGRREELFEAAAPQFGLRYAAAPSPRAQAVTDIVSSMLRLGSRDFRRALAAAGNRLEGRNRDLWAMRTTGWLLPSQVRRVNDMILALSKQATRNEPGGRLYSVTVLLTPLNHRANRTGRRPRKKAAP